MASHHEDFQSRVEPARSSERGFGIVMALALIAAWTRLGILLGRVWQT